MEENDYTYSDYDNPYGETQGNSESFYLNQNNEKREEKQTPFLAGNVIPIKKIVIVVVVLILLLLLLFFQSGFGETEDSLSFKDKNGGKITMKGSIMVNGEITDTFNVEGDALQTVMGVEEKTTKITVKAEGLSKGTKTGTITIKDSGGLFFASSAEITINEDGTITFNIQADEYADLVDGQTFDVNAQMQIDVDTDGDGEPDEIVIIEVPIEILIQQYHSVGCLSLSRTEINKSTPYGILEQEFKFKPTCALSAPLMASVKWKDERMGTVELHIDGASPIGQNLTERAVTMKNSISTSNEYVGKVVFVPFAKYAGEVAIFTVNIGYGETIAEMNFEIALDNLEQCIKFSGEDLVISNENDRAAVTIDVSSCHSDRIEFSICPNYPGCSGGAEEGRISPSAGYFYLSPKSNSTRTINVSRGDIPGVYGMTIFAAVPGHDLALISEKEILVMPTNTIMKPDKFVVSLLGRNSSDSIRVKHSELSEDVLIETGICNFNDRSTDGQGWWREFGVDVDRYSGRGKYQTSLYDLIGWIDYSYLSALSLGYQENFKIKTTFEDTIAAYDATRDAHTQTVTAVERAQEVADAVGETIDLEDTQTVLSVVSITVSLYSLISTVTTVCSSATTLNTQITATSTKAQGLTCGNNQAVKTNLSAASSEMNIAQQQICSTWLPGLWNAYTTANQLKMLYDTLDDSTDEGEINADNSLAYSQEAMTYLDEALEHTTNALNYMLLALEAASVDSTFSASGDHTSAAQYIALAKAEHAAAKEALENANTSLTNADDELTTLYEEWEWDAETINEIAYALSSLLVTISELLGILDTATANLTQVSTHLDASLACSCCTQAGVDGCSGDAALCGTIIGEVNAEIASNSALMGKLSAAQVESASLISLVSTAISTYDMYQQYSNMATEEISASRTQNISTINDYYLPAILAEDLATTSKDAAILGARNLATNELESTAGSDYTRDGYSFDNFNEQRLSGLISTAISTGFINGAYAGGVYTTDSTVYSGSGAIIGFSNKKQESKNNSKLYFATDTPTSSSLISGFIDDCDNRVQLILPDYKINLLKDAKNISIPGGKVLAAWSFNDAQVFDVFEEQEVGVKFVNNSLYNNSYQTVTLKFDKHSHSPTTIESGDFGPFNITDSSVETIEEKFHFKFNAKPRIEATPVTSNINTCSSGLMRGATGISALPNIQLNWQWDEIDESKYLDATQLSIVIAKKMSKLNDALNVNSGMCPEDPALRILETVKPIEVQISKSNCYLPLTTNYYDGHPAIYYYLRNSFVPVNGVPNLNEFMKLIDFNANLVLDGFGIEFQDDFEREYTSQTFQSNTEFTNPSTGISKYFANDRYAYYSSESKEFSSSNDFSIPDAGKYRVRLLGDFQGMGLFNGGVPSAKIIFDLYSLQPVNKNYSPFYYLPIDGSVGAQTKNDRRYYGVGSNSELMIDKTNSVYLSMDQDHALFNISSSKANNFFLMNSLNSMRGKLLDTYFTYNPKQNTVEGSKITFSPNYATPLIVAVPGNSSGPSTFKYYAKEGARKIKSGFENLLFLTGIDKCSYYGAGELAKSIIYQTDIRSGEDYFVALNSGNGTAFLKTILFTPTESTYALGYEVSEKGYFISNSGVVQGDFAGTGIVGMAYNDQSTGQYLIGVRDVIEGVERGNICVARLGNREIYWWADSIYSATDSEGNSMTKIEPTLITECNQQ